MFTADRRFAGAALLIALGALLARPATAAAATPHRALFVGNSYTYFNAPGSFPERYRNLIGAIDPQPAMIASATKGGWTFGKHLADATTAGEALQVALQEGWDVAFLQGQSQLPGLYGVAGGPFPAEQKALVALAQAAKAASDQVVLVLTWGRRDGDAANPALFPTYTAMQDRLDAGIAAMAAAASAAGVPLTIVPVGAAFRALHDQGAGSSSVFAGLYDADGSHPSPLGSHLMALCAVARLRAVDPQTLPAPADLDGAAVKAIAAAAAAACGVPGGGVGDGADGADGGVEADDVAAGGDAAEASGPDADDGADLAGDGGGAEDSAAAGEVGDAVGEVGDAGGPGGGDASAVAPTASRGCSAAPVAAGAPWLAALLAATLFIGAARWPRRRT